MLAEVCENAAGRNAAVVAAIACAAQKAVRMWYAAVVAAIACIVHEAIRMWRGAHQMLAAKQCQANAAGMDAAVVAAIACAVHEAIKTWRRSHEMLAANVKMLLVEMLLWWLP
eukprot:1160143-Pelagomonas_calceolata.AAC.11